ncbi:MAG: HAD-IIA family hydrolase [Actinomycetales bacterium]
MASLRSAYDGLLVDLDGVVYVGTDAVPHAVEQLTGAQQAGLQVGYVTNNANRPAPLVAEHLRELGLEVSDNQVVTSAQIGAGLIRQKFGPGARVLAVGGPGVRLALEAEGLVPVDSQEGSPVAVMQGYGPDVGWRQLAEAAYCIHAGAVWVATNTDMTIPQARGIAPGNGTLVAAVEAAVQSPPQVAGKPQAVAFTAAAERLASTRPLVIGDRLDTDIEGGNAAGFDTLLVLTGVHGYRELVAAPRTQRPTLIAADLRALEDEPEQLTMGPHGSASCGATEVRIEGDRVHRTRGTDQVEAIRATLAVVWAASDDGRAVDLSEELLRTVTSPVGGGG